MRAIRLWSIRNAGFLERFYDLFEDLYVAAAPLARKIGMQRLESPVAAVERNIKGALFDCQMCGRCILSSTGMSCPMNCPKQMRNGPCGGVRLNGHCEVKPDMPCVWVKAYEGSKRMRGGRAILNFQPPADNAIKSTSSWLRVMREKGGGP